MRTKLVVKRVSCVEPLIHVRRLICFCYILCLLYCSNDGQDFSGTIHHKVSKDLETGVTLGWSAGSNATTFNFGGKYNVSDDTSVRMKVSNQSHVGLSLQQKLKDGECNLHCIVTTLKIMVLFFKNCKMKPQNCGMVCTYMCVYSTRLHFYKYMYFCKISLVLTY